MNYRHIARVYLGWFDQEAHNMHTPRAGREDSIVWNDDQTFVIGYTGAHGFRSYQAFVRDIAESRLSTEQARQVLLAAVALVGME